LWVVFSRVLFLFVFFFFFFVLIALFINIIYISTMRELHYITITRVCFALREASKR